MRTYNSHKLGRDIYQTQSWKNSSSKGVGSVSDDWKKGRWPANLIHDGSDEVVANFPHTKSGSHRKGMVKQATKGVEKVRISEGVAGNQGSAARFFYCAKASKSERGEENKHPTVKPLKLMEHLTRLVTPKSGTVLDPFMGSGTTGIACTNNGFNFIGIELDEGYFKIAEHRITRNGSD